MEESDMIQMSNEENQSSDTFCYEQQAEEKHKSKKNKAEESIFTQAQNVVKTLNQENQPVDLFCNVQLTKKKNGKYKRNKDKEPNLLEEINMIELPNEENKSGDTFCDEQQAIKNHKSKRNKDKNQSFTETKNSGEIINEEFQSVDSFCNVKKVKKKHEKPKMNDKEYTDEQERNTIEIPFMENECVNMLCDVQMTKKKCKKSKKKKNEEQNIQVENLANEEIQFVDSFCPAKKIKKKHKKCKNNKNDESTIIEERDLNVIPSEKNQCVDMLCDVEQVEEKHKKSRKNINTEKNGLVEKANEQNQSAFSLQEKQQVKKKLKKSKSDLNKKTLTESHIEISSVSSELGDDSLHDLKHPNIRHKVSKKYEKEPASSVESFIVDTPNEECQLIWDSFSDTQKEYKKSENNARKESSLTEVNSDDFFLSSAFDEDIFLEKCVSDIQEKKNICEKRRSNLKGNGHSSNSNMTNQIQNISEISNNDDLSDDDHYSSNNNENVNFVDESLQGSDSFHSEFCEEPVDFDIPLLHAFEIVQNLTDNQKRELLSQGVTIRKGRYTNKEDKILQKNYEDFAKTHSTLDFFDAFGVGTGSRNSKNTQFLKATHFYVRLGKGLNNRTLKSIYSRARLLLHPHKNNNKLSKTEIEKIKLFRSALNKKFTHIGENLKLPASKCAEAFRWHKKPISKGKWTAEEEKQLIAAIEKVIGSSDLSYDKGKIIPWEIVATYVPSRNPAQCRFHWVYHLGWKSGTERGNWNKRCDKKLVEILCKNGYFENASQVDWTEVYKSFEDFSPAPIHVRMRWNWLKTQIPDFKNKDYKTVLNELFNLYEVSVNETF